jgi:hypothetical protein
VAVCSEVPSPQISSVQQRLKGYKQKGTAPVTTQLYNKNYNILIAVITIIIIIIIIIITITTDRILVVAIFSAPVQTGPGAHPWVPVHSRG